jgi:threonine dehydrogenase-like Zn-dependent dehydrogenase
MLITDVMPLDEITKAFTRVDREDPEVIKVVLEI